MGLKRSSVDLRDGYPYTQQATYKWLRGIIYSLPPLEIDASKEKKLQNLRGVSVWTKPPLSKQHIPEKYWAQRTRYWSKFNQGIKMDDEGWYSVTPEVISQHIARRLPKDCTTVVDAFAGCGGNAIQFAAAGFNVIAIDIDPDKIDYARHNAKIYNVLDTIEFIRGDALEVIPKLQQPIDVMFMSPPWGGPGYRAKGAFDLETMLEPPLKGTYLMELGRAVASHTVLFLPKNISVAQVASLAGTDDVELEMQHLNGKLKTATAYYGTSYREPQASTGHADRQSLKAARKRELPNTEKRAQDLAHEEQKIGMERSKERGNGWHQPYGEKLPVVVEGRERETLAARENYIFRNIWFPASA